MQVIAVVKSSLPVKQDAAESRVDWQNTADFEVLYDGTVGKTVELQYLADIEKNVWKTLTEDIKKTVLQKNKFLMVRQLPLSDSSVRLFFSKNDIINEQYFILGASK
jgi:hypothetical protein